MVVVEFKRTTGLSTTQKEADRETGAAGSVEVEERRKGWQGQHKLIFLRLLQRQLE